MSSLPHINTFKKRKFVIDDVIAKDPMKIEPVLVNFTNGSPNENSNLSGTLYHHQGRQFKRRKNRRILVVDGENFKYVGKNFHEDSVSLDLKEDYFLGVLDETTGHMKLVEMSVITTKPFLHGAVESKLSLVEDSQDKELAYHDKQERVVDGFGGKKSKEALRRYKQYKVTVEEMEDAMNRAVDAADVKVEDLNDDSQSSFISLLPYCNRAAQFPKDIYQITDIIHSSTLNHLSTLAAEVLEEDNTKIKTPLFKLLLTSAKLEKDPDNQLLVASVAFYVYYLVMFLKVSKFDLGKSKHPINDCPKEIQDDILRNFTQGTKRNRTRPRHMEDLALCYIFILTLVANRFEVSKETIVYSIKIEDAKIKVLMNYIGATFTGDGKIFKLKLPIPPINKQIMNKRKK